MFAMCGSKLFHGDNLCPMRSLRHVRLGGEVPRISATVACLCLTILYKQGYCSRRVVFPNHISSQNLICDPSLIMKVPKRRNSPFTFIRLAQKWESPFFHCICDR